MEKSGNLFRTRGGGGYRTLEGFDDLMGVRNTKASQSPLHSEIDALIWTMETFFCYFCNRFFSVGEDGFGNRRMTSLCKLFGGHTNLEEKFQQLRAHPYTTNAKFKDGQSRTQKTTVVCCSYRCGATSLVYRVYMSLFMLLTK